MPERLVLIGPARFEVFFRDAALEWLIRRRVAHVEEGDESERRGRGATLVEELTIEKEHAQKRVAVDQATAQRAGCRHWVQVSYKPRAQPAIRPKTVQRKSRRNKQEKHRIFFCNRPPTHKKHTDISYRGPHGTVPAGEGKLP